MKQYNPFFEIVRNKSILIKSTNSERKVEKVKMTTNTSSERYLWPIIIGILILTLGIPFGIKVYNLDKSQKIAAHLDLAKEVRTALCDDRGTELRSEYEQKWVKAYGRLDLAFSTVSTLRMEEIDAYYDAQCALAKEYLQLAKDANTDGEKLVSHKRVRELRNTTAEQIELLLKGQLESAKSCADAYKFAEEAEAEAGRTDPYADQARIYLSQGSWDFCGFYSQQSVIVSGQVAACSNNLAIAVSMESVLGPHPYVDQARQYQSQQNWSFCAFYAAQAVYDMEARMPTETSPP